MKTRHILTAMAISAASFIYPTTYTSAEQNPSIESSNYQLANSLVKKIGEQSFEHKRTHSERNKTIEASLEYSPKEKKITAEIRLTEKVGFLRGTDYKLVITDTLDKNVYGSVNHIEFSMKNSKENRKTSDSFDLTQPFNQEIEAEINKKYNQLLEWTLNNQIPQNKVLFNLPEVYKKLSPPMPLEE